MILLYSDKNNCSFSLELHLIIIQSDNCIKTESRNLKHILSLCSDQQPRHAGSDSKGLCQAAFYLHPTTGLRSGCREDHHIQGTCQLN